MTELEYSQEHNFIILDSGPHSLIFHLNQDMQVQFTTIMTKENAGQRWNKNQAK